MRLKELKKILYCVIYIIVWLDIILIPNPYMFPPKHIPRVSYGKIIWPNCIHQCDIMFLIHDHYRDKIYKAVLNIIDCTSQYKASISLILKNICKVAKAFRKKYDDQNNPLIWPKLLQCDDSHEFMGKTSWLMQEYNVTIQVIGSYNYKDTVIIEYFNKTEEDILYKI